MKLKEKISSLQFIALGFFITILIGSCILCLPISTKNHEWVPFIDALFTATSATCVTGLSIYDTFEQWSLFGQIIILIMIQIGGLGFMTVVTLVLFIMRKNLGLYERTILVQSAGTFSFKGIVSLIKKILIITFSCEIVGAFILSFQFIKDFGWARGLWFSLFHSISAYCNAGFDLLSCTGEASLAHYRQNPLVILTICSLVIIGGLGFIVWSDLFENKFNFKKLTTHSKIVLVYSLIIIIFPCLIFLGAEWNYSLAGASNFWEKLLGSFFFAVTPRTAGFSTHDYSSFSGAGLMLTMILMVIGGNSGSTAGGLKITTIVVVLANLTANIKDRKNAKLFERSVPESVFKQAAALVILYVLISCTSILAISALESQFTLTQITFEVLSALSTVGLSTGITSLIEIPYTKIILIFLMYAGRVGALSLFSSLMKKRNDQVLLKVCEGKIIVG